MARRVQEIKVEKGYIETKRPATYGIQKLLLLTIDSGSTDFCIPAGIHEAIANQIR
jgi:hypothetical protein